MLYPMLFAVIAIFLWGNPLSSMVADLASLGIPKEIAQSDFANYWLGGRLAVEGSTKLLYEHARYFPVMQEIFGDDIEIRNWSYPPHTLLFLWPLGLMPYKAALVTFLVSGLAVFSFAAFSALRSFGSRGQWASFALSQLPTVFMMLAFMQNGLHLGALALAGFLLMKKSPVLAGLCFAALTIKPQLGILIPVILIFVGAWRTILWSSLFTVALLILSALVFGIQDWVDYIRYTVAYQSGLMHDWNGVFLKMMPGLFASLRVLGFDSHLSQNIHLSIAIICLPFIIWWLYREQDTIKRLFILLAGTFLITPYSFNYDMGAFSVIAGILLTKTEENASIHILCWSFAAAFPAFVLLFGGLNFPISPVFVASILVWAALGSKKQQKPVTNS